MVMLHRSLLLGALLLPLLAPAALAAGWSLADGSAIGFTALQQGSPVEGRFERFSAEIELDPADLAQSSIDVTIDVASIATGHKDRDAALRSASFFEVARWPQARFASGEVVHLAGERYEARGELTMRDVTRAVVLPFTLTIAPDPADGRAAAGARGGRARDRAARLWHRAGRLRLDQDGRRRGRDPRRDRGDEAALTGVGGGPRVKGPRTTENGGEPARTTTTAEPAGTTARSGGLAVCLRRPGMLRQ